MEVKVNTKKQILKSFMGWLPLALVALVFYGALFVGLIMLVLTKFAGLEQEVARLIGLPIAGVLLLISIYSYLNWLTKSLSSYRLAVEGDSLVVKGKAGWGSLNKVVQLAQFKKYVLVKVLIRWRSYLQGTERLEIKLLHGSRLFQA